MLGCTLGSIVQAVLLSITWGGETVRKQKLLTNNIIILNAKLPVVSFMFRDVLSQEL